MPTRGRQSLAQKSLDCFLAQTYPHRELIILDDADAPSFPSGIQDDGVFYLRLDQRLTIPAKRNKCCEMASGDVICHWDSDDWNAPTRIEEQVGRMATGLSVIGYHSMYFFDEFQRKGYWYKSPNPIKEYALGTSLMYTREWWREHQFHNGNPNPNIQEDVNFVREACIANQLSTVSAELLMVATIHPDNTSIRNVSCTSIQYQPVDLTYLPVDFLKTI